VTISAAAAACALAGASWWVAGLVPDAVRDRSAGAGGPLLALAAALAAVVGARLCLSTLAFTVYGVTTLVAPTGDERATAWARIALTASPALVRPALAALLAGGVTLGSIGSAVAATPRPPATAAPAAGTAAGAPGAPGQVLPDPGWTAGASLPGPGWTPSRPSAPPQAQPDVTVVAAAAVRHSEPAPLVVRRGDTLWAIAARQLGPAATDAEIAEQWPRWWAANRAQIGDDPDLLLPGQVLVAPVGGAAR
jgi:nucleoid-associated protein YgaU